MMRVPVFLHTFTFAQHNQSPCGDLFYDSFEFNLEQWEQVGHDCSRSSEFSSSGMYGIELRDNSKTGSSLRTIPLDLSAHQHVSFNFQFRSMGFDESENFMLEVSVDGGKSFSLQENWVHGLDFKNGNTHTESVNIDLNFSSQTIFRISCHASSNNDKLFIDEVQINNCASQRGIAFSAEKNNNLMDIVSVSTHKKSGSLRLKANHAREKFTIYMDLLRGKSGSVEIYNKMGAKLSRSIFDYDHQGELSFPIDYLETGNYSVCVKSSDDKLYVLRLEVGS